MDANMKKMAGSPNMSICAADKCSNTEGLTFSVETMSWGEIFLTSFCCSSRKA